MCMGNSEGFVREVDCHTEDIALTGEIEIQPHVDEPERLADDLQDHLTNCLIEFVISQDA